MNVLVTGASGFTGGFVVPRLIEHGHEVTALVRSNQAAECVEELKAKPIFGDLDDAASIDEAFRASGAEALVNLASLGFGHAPAIVAAAEDAAMRRAVFVSTTAIFTTLDARSKTVRLAAELTVQESALDWTIIRPTMIYGAPGDRNMSRLLRLLRRSPIVPVPAGGRRLQQPVHVEDLASAIVIAVETSEAVGRAYDIAGPCPLPFRQIVMEAANAVGRKPRPVSMPPRAILSILKSLERVGAHGPIKAEQVERLLEDKAFDITDARHDLGYRPRSFAEGIAAEAAV